MIIRPIEYRDLLAVEYNRSICFKVPVDFEKRRWEIAEEKDDLAGRFGAFTDDGQLMSYLWDHPYRVLFDGNEVSCGGIGSVTTLPEYRAGGTMRALMEHTLRYAYDAGEVFSMLDPFSYEFYRKFGYEYASDTTEYVFDIWQAGKYRHTGWAKRLRGAEETDLSPILRLYRKFTAGHNMALVREEKHFRDAWITKRDEEYLNEHTFLYLLGEGEEPGAYVMYRAQAGALEVLDCAYDGVAGLRMLLGFFARMGADYREVKMTLPSEVNLFALLPELRRVQKTVRSYRMVRVINAQRALALADKPAGLSCVVELTDDIIPENAGRYRVTDRGVTRTEAEPDIRMDIRALPAMLIGSLPLDAAVFRPDVKVFGNEDALKQLFRWKPTYQKEHF